MSKKSHVEGLAGILKGLSDTPLPEVVNEVEAKIGPSSTNQPKPKQTIRYLEGTQSAAVAAAQRQAMQEYQEERRGPGRPPGKRSDPNFDRMTVLVRKETLDDVDMLLLKDKNGPKDRSELVELLLRNHLHGQVLNKPE